MNEEIIRILQIGMHNKIGGVETYLINYYRNIDKNKIQFDFINMYDELCFTDEIKKMGGIIYDVSNVKKNPIKYSKELYKIIKNNKYEIVHINMLSVANALPIIVAKFAKCKNIIVHSHNTSTPKNIVRKLLNFLNKILLKMANHFYACSNLAGEWMFGKKALEKNKLVVINNAIDCDKYLFNEKVRSEIRKNLKIEDKFVVGNVGRFSYQKNHKFLIEIFNEIVKMRSDSVLLLIGEGELQEEIENQINKYELKDKVIFLGTTNEVEKYLQAMDVFVFPSRFEGLGIVTIESQATGLRTITSDIVPNEVNITDLVEKVSLNKTPSEWADIIVKNNIKNRCSQTKAIEKKGYNIKLEVKKLEKQYIGMVRNNGK